VPDVGQEVPPSLRFTRQAVFVEQTDSPHDVVQSSSRLPQQSCVVRSHSPASPHDW
jgi:hypothetical protein